MMRSTKFVRFALCTGLALSLCATALGAVTAQDATPEATHDMTMPDTSASDSMMSEMMMQPGACPEGWASTMLNDWSNTVDMGGGMMPTAEATFDMTGDTVPPEATAQAPMDMPMATMEATSDTGMTGTEEMMGVTCLFGSFSGAAEVPGPGDEDGQGYAFVSVDPASGEICYDVAVMNITLPASAIHIHVNSAGLSGDVVVPFPTAPDAMGHASDCTTTEVEGLAAQIAMTPAQYYVNVHTSDFPNGAIRAQLSDWSTSSVNPDMDMNSSMSTPGAMSGEMSDATPESAG
jgi:hypothetical protein